MAKSLEEAGWNDVPKISVRDLQDLQIRNRRAPSLLMKLYDFFAPDITPKKLVKGVKKSEVRQRLKSLREAMRSGSLDTIQRTFTKV